MLTSLHRRRLRLVARTHYARAAAQAATANIQLPTACSVLWSVP